VLTDSRPAADFAAESTALADLPVEFAFGGHPESLLQGADLICVSGGVPLTIPFLVAARNQGIKLTKRFPNLPGRMSRNRDWHHRFCRQEYHHRPGWFNGAKTLRNKE